MKVLDFFKSKTGIIASSVVAGVVAIAAGVMLFWPCPHKNTKVINKVEATCSSEGYTGDTRCEKCEEILKKGKTIEISECKEKVVNEKEATCEAEGYTGDTVCKFCKKEIKKGEIIPITEHVTEVKNEKQATCKEEGYSGDKICKMCKKEIEKGNVLPKAHTIELRNEKKPTCDKEGYSGDKYCTTCEEKIEDGKKLSATHDITLKNKKNATCTAGGYSGDEVCKKCDYTKKGTSTSATGHQNEVRGKKDATTSAEGYTGDTYCKVCNALLAQGNVIPKKQSSSAYNPGTAIEQAIFAQINTFRAENGVPALAWNHEVYPATKIRAQEYINWNNNGMNGDPHFRPDGKAFYWALDDIGLSIYSFNATGECLAASTNWDGTNGIFDCWKTSTGGHREAMLKSQYETASVSVIYDNGRYYASLILCGSPSGF